MATPIRFKTIADAKAHGAICGFCRVTAAEKVLLVCKGCSSAQYCSKECQKRAWKYHKVICGSHRDVPGEDPMIKQLRLKQQTVQKWFHRHRAVVSWACFNAYDLGRHPERGGTHVLLINLDLVMNPQSPKSLFRIRDAQLLTREEHMALRPQDWESLNRGDQEHELRNRRDRVSTNMFLAYGFWAHPVGGYWDAEELALRTMDPQWQKILKSVVAGETEWKMVDGNAVRATEQLEVISA